MPNDKDFSIKVVKGMNHRMNYYMDKHYVNDLVDNTHYATIPIISDGDLYENNFQKLNNIVLN